MTQTLKKQGFAVSNVAEYYTKYYKAQRVLRPVVLSYLFRNICFTTHREVIRAVSQVEYEKVSNATNIPIPLIHKFISRFLIDLIRFKRFLFENKSVLRTKNQSRSVQIYLHKLYRLAPVFDYKRARENAKILRIKLDGLFFWPQVMTQIAVVIFITDLLDKSQPDKIIQANLRALCSCSAYAFHTTRNRIGLTTKYIKKLRSS